MATFHIQGPLCPQDIRAMSVADNCVYFVELSTNKDDLTPKYLRSHILFLSQTKRN